MAGHLGQNQESSSALPRLLARCRAPMLPGGPGHSVPAGHPSAQCGSPVCHPRARPQLAAPCPRAAPAPGDPAAAALRPGESGSPWRAPMAQLAKPCGSVWEEAWALNDCHYQLMGMRVAGERGDGGLHCHGASLQAAPGELMPLEMVSCQSVGWVRVPAGISLGGGVFLLIHVPSEGPCWQVRCSLLLAGAQSWVSSR